MTQEINYCRASDGVRLAYATVGEGPPLVKTANWMNHLEYDWESPVWRHYLTELGKVATVYRFDERGHGLGAAQVQLHAANIGLVGDGLRMQFQDDGKPDCGSDGCGLDLP